MNGIIFELKNKYFFIETEQKKKTKKLAMIFLDYFISRLEKDKQPTNEIIEDACDIIFNKMYFAQVRRSEDLEYYFIHTKYSGATIGNNDLIYIEE